MSEWEGKSKGNTAGYRIFVFLIQVFGIKSAYFILRFVAVYYVLFSNKSSKPILYFYQKRLGFGIWDSRIKLYQNYYLFGQSLIDKVAVMSGAGDKFSFEFDGEQYLHQMVSEGKGGLLLSAHAGNWEAAGHLLKRLGTKINIVMYDGEDKDIKKYMEEVTPDKAFKIIYIKNDISHIFKINAALAANEIVCMHADRYLPKNKKLTCEFIGEEAYFPEGPFLLALKLKVPVAYVYAFKENTMHYHFYSSALKHFSQANGHTVQTILEDFSSGLETMVRKYPVQWFNYYNFWKN